MASILRMRLLRRNNLALCCLRRSNSTSVGTPSQSADPQEDLNKPLTYSTSKAGKWKARYLYGATPQIEEQPRYQPQVVVASVAAFLIYFCVLREENDIDETLYRPLHETIPAFKEQYEKKLQKIKHYEEKS